MLPWSFHFTSSCLPHTSHKGCRVHCFQWRPKSCPNDQYSFPGMELGGKAYTLRGGTAAERKGRQLCMWILCQLFKFATLIWYSEAAAPSRVNWRIEMWTVLEIIDKSFDEGNLERDLYSFKLWSGWEGAILCLILLSYTAPFLTFRWLMQGWGKWIKAPF